MRELFRGFSLMYGPPGSGKTSLALYAAAQMGQKVMYVGFYETVDKVQEKIKGLGLDLSKFVVLDYLSISNVDVLLSNVVDEYEKTSPDVVILDGINALPQSREAAASIYRIFHTPTVAIGEEQIAGSHFAYIADTLLEVSQVFHRGARYRKIRVVKTRLGPSPGAEFYFTISRRGVRIVPRWSQSRLGKEVVASPSGKRVVFAEDVAESLVRAALRRGRPGVTAGSRVGVFLCEHPICLRISAAYLCDYMDNAKVGVLSTYPYIRTAAAHMGCGVNEEVVPASALGEDLALEEALERIGDAAVVFLYGLEEVLHMYGLERVAYVLDFIHSVLPESALLATFRGVEPVSELLHMFNTVWQYFPDRAVVVKSALGWPVRELKIRDEGGRLVFTLT
jgi:KaiC/GvpD/RAD55 family RecA-like ATPase